MQEELATYLASEKAARELVVDDPYMAADQFLQLCRADMLLRKIFSVEDRATPEQIERVARETVKTFLARYARR